MPIAALPPSTVRAIGSTSVISDPASIIKELLDNALDACASSIAIEISQNTLDLIQVKDNGHGIPAEDHPLVCRRAFTSKIESVDDLRNIGGTSLGFRGEALASAAELSGSVTITTRVETEQAGFSIKYGRNGEVISSQRASHPVGTSMRITELFKHIPVRRQTALKNSTKEVLKIKKLVQAYVMARPGTRVSFKVLKARSDASNWVYAPGQDATLMGAALKVVGTEIATRCIYKEWPGSSVSETDSFQPEAAPGFRIVALLPDPELAKFNNAGQYIAIDGRPLSNSRGIARDIVKLCKSHFRSMNSANPSPSPAITDPFLCLHIQCPKGSYDVNIEPSKDDVLFEDSQAPLSMIEDLLRAVYKDNSSIQKDHPGGEAALDLHEEEMHPPQELQSTPAPRRMSMSSFFSMQENAVPASPDHLFDPQRLSSATGTPSSSANFNGAPSMQRRELGFSNSAVTARVSTPFKRPRRPGLHNTGPPSPSQASNRQTLAQTIISLSGTGTVGPRSTSSSLPSPTSSPASVPTPDSTPSPPSNTRPSPSVPMQSQWSLSRRALRERDKERYGNGSLDTWFLRSSQATHAQAAANDRPTEEAPQLSLSQLSQQRFSSEPPPSGEVSLSPDEQTQSLTPANLDRLEPPSLPSPSPPLPDVGPRNKRRELPVLERWSATLHGLSAPAAQTSNTDLERALDFETRKRAAIQERRSQLKSRLDGTSTVNSPHSNRYLAARSALASSLDHRRIGDAVVLSPHDPRAYLMRQLNSTNNPETQGGAKLKRISSSKLPFEKIPEGCDLYNVGLRQPADLSLLAACVKQACKSDSYMQSGSQIEAFTSVTSGSVIEFWTQRLSGLIDTHYKNRVGGGSPNLAFDFSALNQSPHDNGQEE